MSLGTELGTAVTARFMGYLTSDREAVNLARRAAESTDYEAVNRYSIRTGELMGQALAEETQTLAYMSYEVAQETLTPLMTANHEAVTTIAQATQTNMYQAAGVGLSPAVLELDTSRIDGLAAVVAQADTTTEALQRIAEPLINSSQSIVDREIRDNAKQNNKAGLKATIERRTESSGTRTAPLRIRRGNKVYTYTRTYNVPCKWCANLAGVYDYESVKNTGNNVFRRHESCRCIVTYRIGNQRQDVWSKKTWTEEEAEEQRQLTAKELRAQARRERTEWEQKADTRLHEIGFQTVDAKVYRNCNRELLNKSLDKLEELENKFNVFRRSLKTYVDYNGRVSYIAAIERWSDNSAHQGLVLTKYYKEADKVAESALRGRKTGWFMPFADGDEDIYTIAHEYGHGLHNLLYSQYMATAPAMPMDIKAYVRGMNDEIFEIARQASGDANFNPLDYISQYGKTNPFETWAEVFANSQCGAPNVLGDAMNEYLRRKGY